MGTLLQKAGVMVRGLGVRGPMQARQRSAAADHVSIIDKLITETLLQFTSLRDHSTSDARISLTGSTSTGGSAVTPLGINLEDFEGAVAEESEGDRQSTLLVRNTLPADVFEDGNLAALEGPEEPLARRPLDSEPESIEDAPTSMTGPTSVPAPTSMAGPASVPAPASIPPRVQFVKSS